MWAVLRWTIYLLLAALILYFALANRGSVTIYLDPFQGGQLAGPSFEAPFFLVVLAAIALGVFVGGASSWLRHRPLRRDAKIARAEAAKARSEAEQLRERALATLPESNATTTPRR